MGRKRLSRALWRRRAVEVGDRDHWRCRALNRRDNSILWEVTPEEALVERTVQRCEVRKNLEIHHLKNRSQGGTDDMVNLLTLCRGHHRLATLRRPVTYLLGAVPKLAWLCGWEEEGPG